MPVVCKKARRLGLYRGQWAPNKVSWSFKEWTPELAYVAGVYIGDGNVYLKNGSANYFRHSSIDRDFVENTYHALRTATGLTGSIRPIKQNSQFCLTVCNKDFATWLVSMCGPARKKIAPDLDDLNFWVMQGLWDSDGTASKYSMGVRSSANYEATARWVTRSLELGGRNTGYHKGYMNLNTLYWPIQEWTRLGMGTFVSRKTKNGIQLLNWEDT